MYAVGDTHSHMFPVGDDGGEERRSSGMYAVGDAQ